MTIAEEVYKMDLILETLGLKKSFQGTAAVDDVNIHMKKGSVYGFVGPNGAGKSTVMKMILNLMEPDSGEVRVFGEKITASGFEIFKRMGSIIENPYFYDTMTAWQNLDLYCEYMGFPDKERIDEVLRLVDLHRAGNKRVRHYSMGMKQRLAIARAILTRPEILILDEPVNALDPEGIREMRNLFRHLNHEEGTSVLISSHILSEVELIADTIGIIRQGRLMAEVSMDEIHKHQTEYISLQVDNTAHAALLLEKMGIRKFSVQDDENIRIYDSEISGKTISEALIKEGVGLESLWRRHDTLEDYFFRLTEGGLS